MRETGIGIVTSDLRRAMDRVMEMSESDRRALGQKARAIVEQRYSMQAVVSQWEALYRSM